MNNNKKLITLIVILSLLVVGLIGYIIYDKTFDKEEFPINNAKDHELQNVENQNTTPAPETKPNDESNGVISEYYGEDMSSLSNIDTYTMSYEDYTITVGYWTNEGQSVTIKDAKNKTVLNLNVRSNFSAGDDDVSVSLIPYLNVEEGRLYVADDGCGKPYIGYVDLNKEKLELTVYKDLSKYNLTPDGISGC